MVQDKKKHSCRQRERHPFNGLLQKPVLLLLEQRRRKRIRHTGAK